jgi:hypothetical protein
MMGGDRIREVWFLHSVALLNLGLGWQDTDAEV